MPGYDGSGPFGAGPMTGGARGHCNPADTGYGPRVFGPPGFGAGMGLRRGFRGGMGRGRGGFGRGFGSRRYPPAYFTPYVDDKGGELEMLKAQADSLGKTLDAINRRMTELEKSSE